MLKELRRLAADGSIVGKGDQYVFAPEFDAHGFTFTSGGTVKRTRDGASVRRCGNIGQGTGTPNPRGLGVA